MNDVELLRELSGRFGVSGFEEEVCQSIQERVKGLGDRTEVDVLGNLMVWVNPGQGFTVMLDAHMDEIGIMVSHIEEDGFLRFALIGGWDPRVLPGQRVELKSRGGSKHQGVIGALPPHVQTADEQKQPYKVEDLFIDLGAESKEAVATMEIGPGSPGVLCYPFQTVGSSRVMGKALDDRVGCVILIRCLEYLSRNRPDFTVVVNFAVSEEVGLRGARTASYQIQPHVALAVEGTIGADTPGIPAHKCPARLGKGPAISVADKTIIVNPNLVRFIEEAADTVKIPWQYRLPLAGGTDAGAIQLSRGGVLAGVISVPCRYIHSPSGILDLRDLKHTITLLLEVLRRAPELRRLKR